jgi:glycine cleavage system H lipoate-binding protein
LSFVFASDDGSATIGVVVFVTEGLGFVVQLTLDNIGTLHWHYNNTLNQLSKADKSNTTQYYVYDYQGRRVRTVVESNNFLLNLSFVFASDDGSATIGVVVFVTEGLKIIAKIILTPTATY